MVSLRYCVMRWSTFLCPSRWRQGKRQKEYSIDPETSLQHERQHLCPASPYLERRVRRLAVLQRGGTPILQAAETAKPDPSGVRRLQLFDRVRPLFVVLSPGLASASDGRPPSPPFRRSVLETGRRSVLRPRLIRQRQRDERTHL